MLGLVEMFIEIVSSMFEKLRLESIVSTLTEFNKKSMIDGWFSSFE